MAPPNAVPLHKLQFNPKSAADFERNLKVFRSTAKKMQLHSLTSDLDINQMAQGRYMHNFQCLQALHEIMTKQAPNVQGSYAGFERRLEAFKK